MEDNSQSGSNPNKPMIIGGIVLLLVLVMAGFGVVLATNTTKSPSSNPNQSTPIASVSSNNNSKNNPGNSAATALTIDVTDGGYSQQTVNLQVGKQYEITVDNKGTRAHSLTSSLMDTGSLAVGETKTMTVIPTTTGTYDFHCTVPCGPYHMEMQDGFSFVVS